MGTYKTTEADVDAGKWVPDPFQAATLTLTLGLTRPSGDTELVVPMNENITLPCPSDGAVKIPESHN